MGVRDLGKIIKARSPSSVTTYTSLAPFRGKRFAIDANLLTTKFHYAEAGTRPPDARLGGGAPLGDGKGGGHSHARAWYWFLEALRKHGIHPVVVFDGDTRLAAKAPENERRRDARALQGARAAAEGGRGARLREVEAVMARIADDERPAVVEGFRHVVERMWSRRDGSGGGELVPAVAATGGEGSSAAAAAAAVEQRVSLTQIEALLAQDRQEVPPSSAPAGARPLVAPAEPLPLEAADSATAAASKAAIRDIDRLLDVEQAPASAPASPSTDPLPTTADEPHPSPLANLADADVSPSERPPLAHSPDVPPTVAVSPPISPEAALSPSLAAALAASRLANTAKLTSLAGPGPAASHGAIVAHVVALATLFAEYRADVLNPVYSRNQARVTEDEGRFFEGLLRYGTPAEAAETAVAAASDAASEDGRELGEKEEEEESPVPPTKDAELGDIIAQSDKYFDSHLKRSDGVPRAAFKEVRRLVAALGVPYLEPSPHDPHEAEGVCAALCTLGHADYVVSEDLDAAVYGAPLLRFVTVTPAGTGREPKKPMTVLDPARLRDDLGLTRAEFVDFALLCGTDFTDRVYKVGPVLAHKLIVTHSTIERALAANDAGLKPALVLPEAMDREAYLERIRAARAIFNGVPQLPLPLAPSSSSTDSSSLSEPSSSSSTPSPSTFLGSLTPSPPSPILPALLRSYGIHRSRHLSSRGTATASPALSAALDDADVDVDLGEDVDDVARGRELDELEGAESGSSGLGLGLDEWARAQEALDAALVDDGDVLGQEWDGAVAGQEDEGSEGEGGEGREPARSVSDEFERLYL
ncbi:uncharacterized protein RHOBADRAFT_53535 [Rhodotorula graminis WP1]|uniref:PIN domain-like protein n=1 Tax=Rhodotorula graminis (strain WP1) TaxID=578459 RepID=A0A194S4Y1_RHOGW|nr:uncharacterized protein RHOBADRAFT_53535 [Rhodotorula graminis WP1]KPV75570.1 hypothetical protein RHOBADRAFT_53535 [Rhodotorula graminis WP1]